jgi:hypothetical protein
MMSWALSKIRECPASGPIAPGNRPADVAALLAGTQRAAGPTQTGDQRVLLLTVRSLKE